jgi:hypothetical protein
MSGRRAPQTVRIADAPGYSRLVFDRKGQPMVIHRGSDKRVAADLAAALRRQALARVKTALGR